MTNTVLKSLRWSRNPTIKSEEASSLFWGNGHVLTASHNPPRDGVGSPRLSNWRSNLGQCVWIQGYRSTMKQWSFIKKKVIVTYVQMYSSIYIRKYSITLYNQHCWYYNFLAFFGLGQLNQLILVLSVMLITLSPPMVSPLMPLWKEKRNILDEWTSSELDPFCLVAK